MSDGNKGDRNPWPAAPAPMPLPEDLMIRYYRDTGRIEIHGQPPHIALGMLRMATIFCESMLTQRPDSPDSLGATLPARPGSSLEVS